MYLCPFPAAQILRQAFPGTEFDPREQLGDLETDFAARVEQPLDTTGLTVVAAEAGPGLDTQMSI